MKAAFFLCCCSLVVMSPSTAMADCMHQGGSHPKGSYICHSGKLMECNNNEWQSAGTCTRDDAAVEKLDPLMSELDTKIQELGLPSDSFQGIVLRFDVKIDDPSALERFKASQPQRTSAAPTDLEICWEFYKGLKCRLVECD